MTISKWTFYKLREISLDGKKANIDLIQDWKSAVADGTLITLVRYCPDMPKEPIHRGSFWTEVITNDPEVVSQVTGIGPNRCVWRVEWSFTHQEAEALAEPGEERFCRLGTFHEYESREPVALNNCKITNVYGPVENCNLEHPMPQDETRVGRWIHHDVEELQDFDVFGVKYKCLACGLMFMANNSRYTP